MSAGPLLRSFPRSSVGMHAGMLCVPLFGIVQGGRLGRGSVQGAVPTLERGDHRLEGVLRPGSGAVQAAGPDAGASRARFPRWSVGTI
ncbi:hypothetical protein [Pseudomonas sp. FME51]|uniref:hypothetical protein n=1 Tax=Pseudomonas sp. FME51 TaxID=2742609 RepID=UPI001865C71D|nr:hypothetical protein [Pseudomonas sp. FME51]